MNNIRDRAMEFVNHDLIYAQGIGGGERSPPFSFQLKTYFRLQLFFHDFVI